MSTLKFSKKGQELIRMYEKMAREGYHRVDQKRVDDAFSDFELRAYRPQMLSIFNQHSISSVLDYGCGGSDWRASGFDETSNQSAIEYFKLRNAYRYEPARGIVKGNGLTASFHSMCSNISLFRMCLRSCGICSPMRQS